MKKLNLEKPSPSKEVVVHGNRITIPFGGQHTAPVGTSTRDDERLAVYWFNLELSQYAGTADVAW